MLSLVGNPITQFPDCGSQLVSVTADIPELGYSFAENAITFQTDDPAYLNQILTERLVFTLEDPVTLV